MSVVAVVTQPDRPKGRDLRVQPTPVKVIALRHDLPVLQPERARDPGFIEALRELRPDLIAVAAYGQILPPSILDLPPHGCLNVHTSLLPKYRGAAPIQWAIINGEEQTGVTIMKMDRGLDTGDVLTQEATPILPEDDSQTLHDRLAAMGARLLVRTIPPYVSRAIQPQPQPAEGATHAPKIRKEDGLIDWAQPARVLWNRLRGLTPWPGMFTHGEVRSPKSEVRSEDNLKQSDAERQTPGTLLKIWRAEVAEGSGPPGTILAADKQGILVACGTESLRITCLQREGGKRLSAAEFLFGHKLTPGIRLG